METITAKCIKNKNCFVICNTMLCQRSPFMCNNDECECLQAHKTCKSNIRWKIFKELLQKKIKESSVEIKNYLKQVEEVYQKTIKQIQKSLNYMRSLQYTLSLNRVERDIFLKIKQKQYHELNGEIINKVQINTDVPKITIKSDNFENQKQAIVDQTKKLVMLLLELTKQRQPVESKLIKDTEIISQFFNKKIKKLTLLYRASQNKFQISKFWDKCHDKKNTITLIKTQFGKIIGGFTPLTWKTSLFTGNYQKDDNKQSFIFSVTEKEKLSIMNTKEDKTICHYNTWGPIFGGGWDLFICNKANQIAHSGANPGHTFNLNSLYTYNNQSSWKKFYGGSNGRNFLIEEWEIHQITFQ